MQVDNKVLANLVSQIQILKHESAVETNVSNLVTD